MRKTFRSLRRYLSAVGTAACLIVCSLSQAADTDPHSAPTNPLTYDARVVGLGGAGVATADGGAASLHNPALLQQTKQVAVTLTLTPYLVQLSQIIIKYYLRNLTGFLRRSHEDRNTVFLLINR